MNEQMGEAIQNLLDRTSNPAMEMAFVLAALTGMSAYFTYLFLLKKFKWDYTYMWIVYPWWGFARGVRNFHIRYFAWRARREREMQRKRLLALKERAAGALIEWLQQEVYTGGMTLEESYDLQTLLATSIAYPAMAPKYEPEFVKKQIKARRARGHKPVPLPDLDRRSRLKIALAD